MIKLISTDFDGTIFAEFEDPPVPRALEERIAELQAKGVKWVINTGRELSSLMEAMGRARLSVKPDFLVLVEREIYHHRHSEYIGDSTWNSECARRHAELFARVQRDVPRLCQWIEDRFSANLYSDPYSPLCLIAEKNEDADAIHQYLSEYARTIPGLVLVRNDVYSRFCHEAYDKGIGLSEIARQIGITPEETFAVGDHLNDLPMLLRRHAACLAAPANAIPIVKETVRKQDGFISRFNQGRGVLEALDHHLARVAG